MCWNRLKHHLQMGTTPPSSHSSQVALLRCSLKSSYFLTLIQIYNAPQIQKRGSANSNSKEAPSFPQHKVFLALYSNAAWFHYCFPTKYFITMLQTSTSKGAIRSSEGPNPLLLSRPGNGCPRSSVLPPSARHFSSWWHSANSCSAFGSAADL